MEEKIYKLEFTIDELNTIMECGQQVCTEGIGVICEINRDYLIYKKTMILASIYQKISDAFAKD